MAGLRFSLRHSQVQAGHTDAGSELVEAWHTHQPDPTRNCDAVKHGQMWFGRGNGLFIPCGSSVPARLDANDGYCGRLCRPSC